MTTGVFRHSICSKVLYMYTKNKLVLGLGLVQDGDEKGKKDFIYRKNYLQGTVKKSFFFFH